MPLAIISEMTRRSSSVTPGSAPGGQDDRHARLIGRADGVPVQPAVLDLVAHLEPEHVTVEGQGGVGVVVREKGGVNGDVHGGHASRRARLGASRFLTGLETRFAMHGGIPCVACARSSR